MRKTMAIAAAIGLGTTVTAAHAQDLKLGFIATMNHPLGQAMVNGWKLGLKSEGWTKDGDMFGGVKTSVVYGDDQRKADVGRQVADQMIKSDKVDVVAGMIWSNVLMAVQRPVTRAKRILMATNAGASPMFGKRCSPYFISTSWNNDQPAEATGKLMTTDKVKSVYALAPNYQAGKDLIAGMIRTLKGAKVVGRSLFKLGQKDFQAEITRIRAANPDAVYIFAPGPMGISFLKQWAASGMQDKAKLYTVFVVDWFTLPIIGKQAMGSSNVMYWNADLDFPANKQFVKDYLAAYGKMPVHYAAQSYDAPRLLAAGLRAAKGNYKDKLAWMKAMRSVKYESVRGPYTYNINGAPIQNFYQREVVMKDGKPYIETKGIIYKDYKDSFWKSCPKKGQLQ